MKYLDKLNEADRRTYAAASNAYGRHCALKYSLSKEEMDELFIMGEPEARKPYELVLEDWAPVVEKATGESVGLMRRVKGRPLAEILKKLSSGLQDAGLIVDEYFDVSPDARYEQKLDEWPENAWRILCFAVEGGSEGHYVHVDVLLQQPYAPPKYVSMFLLKTFLGLEHALRLSNELTRLLHA
jgi:hypothetical protein